jgi:hypothetical protein
MLGFSLPKLLVLGLIVAAIWYGFKFFGSGRISLKSKTSGDDSNTVTPDAVDMVQCATCSDFVTVNGRSFCGKEGCPYPE